VAVRIRLTESTDTMYSFYLQRNIYNIYTTENSLEHVVPVASLHRHVRLRVCSTVCVCLPGRQRVAFIWNPATYVTSRTLSISTCGLSRISRLSITVDHQHIKPRVADLRVESFNALTATVSILLCPQLPVWVQHHLPNHLAFVFFSLLLVYLSFCHK